MARKADVRSESRSGAGRARGRRIRAALVLVPAGGRLPAPVGLCAGTALMRVVEADAAAVGWIGAWGLLETAGPAGIARCLSAAVVSVLARARERGRVRALVLQERAWSAAAVGSTAVGDAPAPPEQ